MLEGFEKLFVTGLLSPDCGTTLYTRSAGWKKREPGRPSQAQNPVTDRGFGGVRRKGQATRPWVA